MTDKILNNIKILSVQPTSESLSFIDYVNQYSNMFNAITAIAAIVAVYISFRAIRISIDDNRKQVLAHKIEEIYESAELLSQMYGQLYGVYIILENTKKEGIDNVQFRNLRTQFKESNSELQEKIDIEDLLTKAMRLNMLANIYLVGNIKYDVIAYSQLFIAILYILKYENLKLREPEFNEPLPEPINLHIVSDDINTELINVIGYGSETKGYINYRNTIFKNKIYPKKS